MEPNLYIVATPIGNLGDISERAITTIKFADFIICENPKHSLKLLNKLGIKKKLISLHDYNENTVIQKISNDLRNKKLVLISDSGSPLISDPGFKLIQYCIKNKIGVTSVPGATSIMPAIQLSGIPANEFSFFGFFPKSKREMQNFLYNIKKNDRTSIFFVSSHKLENCLELIEGVLSDNFISISKELTKINEKVFWGYGYEIRNKVLEKKENIKGEFVVVVRANIEKKSDNLNLENYNSQIIKLLSKFSLTDVVEIVHKLSGIAKNKVYKWVLKLK